MPSGVILSSGSQGATQEAIEKVLEANGYETEKPVVEAPAEPKRDDFKTEEEFAAAQEAFDEQQERQEQQDENETEADRKERERKETARKPTRKQRAIEKATKDLRTELQKANERIAALEGKGGKRESELVLVAPEVPKREKFKSDAEFEEAMFDYRYQLRRAREGAQEAVKAQEARLKQNFTNYQSGVADFKEEHDDWEDVVNSETPINESTYLSVIELGEDGPAVTYYLGKHPDYARKLAEMSPHSAAMEVGRLSARLKTGASDANAAGNGATRKPKTRIPEPVKPVSTAATSSTLTSAEAAKKRDFRAFKAAQRRGV
jgi:hypothetical protein